MARYTGAVCRQCRREGQKLFLKARDAIRTSARLTAEATPQVSMDRDAKKYPNMVCS